jgi:hypothetical protein
LIATEVVTYGGFWYGTPNRKFEKDAAKRAAEGWRVVAVSTQPRTVLTGFPPKVVATYQRG